MHLHTFGQFELPSEDGVIGQFGVNACLTSNPRNCAWDYSARVPHAVWHEMHKLLLISVAST